MNTPHPARRIPPPRRWRARALAAALLAGGLGACTADLPSGAAAPDGPSLVLNPACTAPGGTTHPAASITSTQSWAPSGNPHRVTGTITVDAGGYLRIQAGALVCFDAWAGIVAQNGGYFVSDGDGTSGVVLTATDPAQAWAGVLLKGTPAAASFVRHTLVEHVHPFYVAVESRDRHATTINTSVIRQSGVAALLMAPGSRIMYSRVDTTTHPYHEAAVTLGDSTRFTLTTIRGASGHGLQVNGDAGVELLGGRIEGSGYSGLAVWAPGAILQGRPIRVLGSGHYPAIMTFETMEKMYASRPAQDSLLGNTRDTLQISGVIRTSLWVRADLPWYLRMPVVVDSGGVLRAEPGATLDFALFGGITAQNGGRVVARGTAAQPILFTGSHFAGWDGVELRGAPAAESYLTNVRMQHVNAGTPAVYARDSHKVTIDSVVFRQNGWAATLASRGSRIRRSRVDTTTAQYSFAVYLTGDSVLMENTRIRGAYGAAVGVWSPTAAVSGCEIRESGAEGIQVAYHTALIRNCNLVNNAGPGMLSYTGTATPANASGNWWGDTAGPTGPSGDGVSGPVNYTPHRTTPYVLPYIP
jgi:hypothetical protein